MKKQKISLFFNRINQFQTNYKRYLFEEIINRDRRRTTALVGSFEEIKNSPTSGNHRCYTRKNICADSGYLKNAL